MRIVGLTSGITSGKSTVSNLFKAYGVPIVETDIVALVAVFGEETLQADGEVDRPKLGRIVFSDPVKHQVIVLDILLLFEAKMDKWTKPIVVVWVDPETQLRQLMPLDLKRSKADKVIGNTGSIEDFSEQFQKAQFQVMWLLTWTNLHPCKRDCLFKLQ
ncbi:hypothetical protein ACJRO7_020150 [Eucalyptus globulus]|uniref:Dephospho-CoA kinase n=1 Tax=Eucalyptus globulus TaxID=34317 RepID=A0ABD3KFP6_EUCGL